MNKVLAILLSTILLVTECSPSKGRGMTATPVEGMTATSIHFTATPVLPSATPPILPTSTVTPSPSPSPSPTTNPAIERRCPEFMGGVLMETVASGTIVLGDFKYNNYFFYTTLLDLQSGKDFSLPFQLTYYPWPGGIHPGSASPDRKYYAYTERNEDSNRTIVWVINAEAEVIRQWTFDGTLHSLRWLDNERILLVVGATHELVSFAVFDLNKIGYNFIFFEYSDYYNVDSVFFERVIFSPDLQKVWYVGSLPDVDGLNLIYRDLVSQRVLWETPVPVGFGNPVWSPDGRQFASMVGYDLYIIQADGQVVDILKKEEFGYFNEWSYGWSPNGEYIGFRSSKEVGRYATSTLMVYDLKSKKAVDYCLLGPSYDDPVWSPDSTQMIVGSSWGGGGTLIDLPTNRSYKLVDFRDVMYPLSWMFSLPDEE